MSFSFSTTCSVVRRAAASLAYVGEEREKIRLAPGRSDCTYGICLRPSAEYNRESTASLVTFYFNFSWCRIVTRDYCAKIRAQPRRLQPMSDTVFSDLTLDLMSDLIYCPNGNETRPHVHTDTLYKDVVVTLAAMDEPSQRGVELTNGVILSLELDGARTERATRVGAVEMGKRERPRAELRSEVESVTARLRYQTVAQFFNAQAKKTFFAITNVIEYANLSFSE
ncbi:unnamed protein product, partial [Trichogramma brassicae]